MLGQLKLSQVQEVHHDPAAQAVAEVTAAVGPMEGAVVKWHTSNSAGRTLMPEAAQVLIGEKVRAGLERREQIRPFTISGPLQLELAMKNREAAELLAYLPNIDRIDAHTIRFTGDIVELSMFIEMVLGYPDTMTH